MQILKPLLTAAAVALAATSLGAGDSAGLLNDALRKQSPAFSPWNLGGDVRLRAESYSHLDGATPSRDFQAGLENSNSYWWFRETAHVGYTATTWSTYVELQNAHATSDANPRRPGEERLDVYHAYLVIGNAKSPFTATLGRQELAYGDQRLIGTSSWANTGRAFDAVKARWTMKSGAVDAFVGNIVPVVDGEFNTGDHRDRLSGVLLTAKNLVAKADTQFYAIARNTAVGGATAARDIYSLGAALKSQAGKTGPWNYAAEIVAQFGDITQGGVVRDQRAFAFTAGGGYTWKDRPGAPKVSFEYNFSSGDSDPTDGTSETLDVFFGGNHSKYGVMDVVGWRNIHELRANLNAKPAKTVTLAAELHGFWLADTNDYFYPQGGSGRNGNGYGRNAAYDSFIGTEATLEVIWARKSWQNFRVGVGRFLAGSYIDQSKAAVGGSTDAGWSYVQATFSF